MIRKAMFGQDQAPTERDLAALADGSLPASRRVRVERAVAESPELQAIVAAERRALSAIAQAGGEPAPAALRARLELLQHPDLRTRAPVFAPASGRAPRLGRWLPVGALAAAAAGIAIVFALSGGPSAPTVAQAALLANRTPSAPAPAQRGNQPLLAKVEAAGLPFPYWQDRFGFRAVGVRRDRLDGRAATTVFYRRGNASLAYTIVGGPALAAGARSWSTVRHGTWVKSLTAGGMRVVSWLRHDHSCVLVGRGVSERTLVSLASWRGDGGIPY